MKYRKYMSVKNLFFSFLMLTLVVCLGWAFFLFMERNTPELTLLLENTYFHPDRTFQFQARDKGRGLRELHVHFFQAGKDITLLEKKFELNVWEWNGELSFTGHRISNGPAELVFTVIDRSLNNLGKGNIAVFRQAIVIDSVAPKISINNNTEYLNQGGSGIVSYTLSEQVEKTGVVIANHFFPAYKQEKGNWLCLFSFPYSADPETDRLELVAVDAAGNEGKVKFFQRIRKAAFPHDIIRVNDRFLKTAMPDFQQYFPTEQNLLELYLKVNNELRKENRATLVELGRQTAKKPLWEGRFLQLRNSATRATFGDKRTYLYEGKKIDYQVHLGLDFASVARAPVQACNHGQVVFAGLMGIYGQVVVLDHGLGLQSLYAHLSQIDVTTGDVLKKGDVIGKTGTTGLAGGDHLHLGLAVSGMLVNPIEWLDPKWIQNSITRKMN